MGTHWMSDTSYHGLLNMENVFYCRHITVYHSY